jgi:hypothetical protein
MNERSVWTCCLCLTPQRGFGNNPEPLASHPERCCDDCNTSRVIPARLVAMSRSHHPTARDAS